MECLFHFSSACSFMLRTVRPPLMLSTSIAKYLSWHCRSGSRGRVWGPALLQMCKSMYVCVCVFVWGW